MYPSSIENTLSTPAMEPISIRLCGKQQLVVKDGKLIVTKRGNCVFRASTSAVTVSVSKSSNGCLGILSLLSGTMLVGVSIFLMTLPGVIMFIFVTTFWLCLFLGIFLAAGGVFLFSGRKDNLLHVTPDGAPQVTFQVPEAETSKLKQLVECLNANH